VMLDLERLKPHPDLGALFFGEGQVRHVRKFDYWMGIVSLSQ
jgi:hypothetical protein